MSLASLWLIPSLAMIAKLKGYLPTLVTQLCSVKRARAYICHIHSVHGMAKYILINTCFIRLYFFCCLCIIHNSFIFFRSSIRTELIFNKASRLMKYSAAGSRIEAAISATFIRLVARVRYNCDSVRFIVRLLQLYWWNMGLFPIASTNPVRSYSLSHI